MANIKTKVMEAMGQLRHFNKILKLCLVKWHCVKYIIFLILIQQQKIFAM